MGRWSEAHGMLGKDGAGGKAKNGLLSRTAPWAPGRRLTSEGPQYTLGGYPSQEEAWTGITAPWGPIFGKRRLVG
jgi:hypothetical protein